MYWEKIARIFFPFLGFFYNPFLNSKTFTITYLAQICDPISSISIFSQIAFTVLRSSSVHLTMTWANWINSFTSALWAAEWSAFPLNDWQKWTSRWLWGSYISSTLKADGWVWATQTTCQLSLQNTMEMPRDGMASKYPHVNITTSPSCCIK